MRPPKYGSERIVYLPDDLVTILSEHVGAHLADADRTRWLFTVGDEPMYDNAITGGGARPGPPPGFRTSGSTTCGTSSPPA